MELFKKKTLYPIEIISKKKKRFLTTIEKFITKDSIDPETKENLLNTLEYVILSEKRRIKNNPYKFDPKDDNTFWSSLELKIKEKYLTKNDLRNIFVQIIKRYLEEIFSSYHFPYYKFLKMTAIKAFSIIFKPFKLFSINKKDDIFEYVNVLGNFDLIENLNQKATFVLVPTHYSHFDSIMAGASILRLNEIQDIDVDMPIYAAGFNLYEYKIFKHWISKCGIYEIDRRKKNRVYLQTIKTFYQMLILNNCNSLFYPAGTRSRDGSLENSLKYGLLGTLLEAQRFSYQNLKEKARKIIILPIALSYESVFEADSLITQFLSKFKISKKKNSKISLKNIIYKIYSLIKRSSRARAVFGRPMDVLGNFVDEDANSFDKNKNKIDLYQYLQNYNFSKEENYSNLKNLESKILLEYKKSTYIFISQIIAYACFEYIRNLYKNKDDKEFWNLKLKNIKIEADKILPRVLQIISLLQNMENGPILDKRLYEFLQYKNIMEYIDSLGAYHDKAPLKKYDENSLTSESIELLYYYSNKLKSYVT